MGVDKISAYQTLFEVLLTLAKLIAPYIPFVAEALYRNLNGTQYEPYESVHLAFFPDQTQPEYSVVDKELMDRMAITREVVSAARALRSKAGMKVRQPLQKIVVAVKSEEQGTALSKMQDLILEEINVKTLEILDKAEGLTILKAKGNYKTLGPKYGNKVKLVVDRIENMQHLEIVSLQENNQFELSLGNGNILVTQDDVIISTGNPPGMLVQNQDNITVGLVLKVSTELKEEGFAREFVNRVQNMRKEHGLEVIDRIEIDVRAPGEFLSALSNWKDYVKNETLAENLGFKGRELEYSKKWKIDDLDIEISISALRVEGFG